MSRWLFWRALCFRRTAILGDLRLWHIHRSDAGRERIRRRLHVLHLHQHDTWRTRDERRDRCRDSGRAHHHARSDLLQVGWPRDRTYHRAPVRRFSSHAHVCDPLDAKRDFVDCRRSHTVYRDWLALIHANHPNTPVPQLLDRLRQCHRLAWPVHIHWFAVCSLRQRIVYTRLRWARKCKTLLEPMVGILLVIEGRYFFVSTRSIELDGLGKGAVGFQVNYRGACFPRVPFQRFEETPPKPKPTRLWRDPHALDLRRSVGMKFQSAAADQLLAQTRHKDHADRRSEFMLVSRYALRWVKTSLEPFA